MVPKSDVSYRKKFQDSLIIDKYDPQITEWCSRRSREHQSENMEDALVWNVFRSLKQIDPTFWLGALFTKTFKQEFTYALDTVHIHLWKKVRSPKNVYSSDGLYEIDVIIETEQFTWFFIAKYKSDIRLQSRDKHKLNQIIHTIDAGLQYTKERDFYFSLIHLNPYHTPFGQLITSEYQQSTDAILQDLPYRTTEISLLKGINLVTWNEIYTILKGIYLYNKSKYEKFVASQTCDWLYEKIEDDLC